MKLIVPILFIILIHIFSLNSFAQQIPNSSFEAWSGGEPDNWNTSNQNIPLIGVITTVSKDLSDPQQGETSVKLTTIKISIPFNDSYTIPAALTLGKLNIDLVNKTASVNGGYPFSGNPTKLTGYYKYQPVNNDKCVIGMGLFGWTNGTRDTLGFGAIDTLGTTNTWTRFEVPVQYLMDGTPDTMNILIVNSNPIDGLDHTGTIMWVDNLSFEYGSVGIEGLTSAKNIRIFAEPYARQLILSSTFGKQENLDISLFNMSGTETMHWKRTMQLSTEHLDVSNLMPGTYVIRISSGNRIIDARKITMLN
jgi:hypothetical protein